jgi:hypothetical protein
MMLNILSIWATFIKHWATFFNHLVTLVRGIQSAQVVAKCPNFNRKLRQDLSSFSQELFVTFSYLFLRIAKVLKICFECLSQLFIPNVKIGILALKTNLTNCHCYKTLAGRNLQFGAIS